jgi:hypothetical protein
MPIVELYPWHSAHVTAATHPPTDVLNHFVLGTTRRARGHFGFDRPWWDAANELGLELTAALGSGGMDYCSTVPSRAARVYKTPSWHILMVECTLEARPAQSERSPIPAPPDLHAIRPAAHHTVSIGAALRGCALYTYEFLFGRSTNQRITGHGGCFLGS